MYKAVNLSKYIVSKCMKDGHPISNLQLQKILYYIQKTYLQQNQRAFSDDIEAWQFGPVVPSVYYYFCGYGSMPITRIYNDSPANTDEVIINAIVDAKKELNPWDMVAETHKRNGAWDLVYNGGRGNHQIIPTDLIRKAG